MQRTDSQRKAIEVYCRLVAEELWRNGHTMQDVVKAIKRAEIRPTQARVKEIVWNGISEAQLQKPSSTMLEKHEVTEVYERMNKFIGQEFGIHIPFPQDEDKISNYQNKVV